MCICTGIVGLFVYSRCNCMLVCILALGLEARLGIHTGIIGLFMYLHWHCRPNCVFALGL